MSAEAVKHTTIDAYIADFPEDVQAMLQDVRRTIQQAAPQATEKIAYAIPTFYQEGNLVSFAGYQNHIGFYPAPIGIEQFKHELRRYASGKGSAQFPLSEPMPLDLIRRITEFRVGVNLEHAAAKKKGKQ